jgi:hypothetical protein
MPSHRSRFATTAAVGACLAGAPAASADDAGVFSAYTARQANGVDPAGEKYLRAVRGWRRANNDEIRALRALIDGDRARANRWLRRATRKMRRTFRHGRTAVAQFKAVGLTSPVGAISDP